MAFVLRLLFFPLFLSSLNPVLAGDKPFGRPLCYRDLGHTLSQRFLGSSLEGGGTGRILLFASGAVALGLGAFYSVRWARYPNLPASLSWTQDDEGNEVPLFLKKPSLSLSPKPLSAEYLVHNDIESWGTVKISKSEISGQLNLKFFDTRGKLIAQGSLQDGPTPGQRALAVYLENGKFLGSAVQALNFKNQWGPWILGVQSSSDMGLNSNSAISKKDPRVLVLLDSLQAYLNKSQANEFWSVKPN